MIRVNCLAVKIIGVVGGAALLCCLVLPKSHAAGNEGVQQATTDFNPTVPCPNATLSDIESVNPVFAS